MGLAEILEVEALGDDVWRGRGTTAGGVGRSDIFGGEVAGRALRAAAETVDNGYLPSSVHCCFMRRGQGTLPLDLHVVRERTGRTYATRRVDARQDGRSIFTMLATFHVEEPGREFDHPMAAGIPDPDDLPAPEAREGWAPLLEQRDVPTEGPLQRWWGRIAAPFPSDPVAQACGLLYASDMRTGGAAMQAVGYTPGPPRPGEERQGNFGSLDHALWFHRVPVVDDWVLFEVRPLTVRDSRGLVLGTAFDRSGTHLATFTQEVFMKAAPEP